MCVYRCNLTLSSVGKREMASSYSWHLSCNKASLLTTNVTVMLSSVSCSRDNAILRLRAKHYRRSSFPATSQNSPRTVREARCKLPRGRSEARSSLLASSWRSAQIKPRTLRMQDWRYLKRSQKARMLLHCRYKSEFRIKHLISFNRSALIVHTQLIVSRFMRSLYLVGLPQTCLRLKRSATQFI